MNGVRGYEIYFEGPDGSGKGTQVSLAAEALRKTHGRPRIMETKEPWRGDETKAVIRGVLDVDQPNITIPADVLQWVFMLNRRAHRNRLVFPSLRDHKIVLQDRSWVSTITYLAATSDRTYEEARDWVFAEHKLLLGSAWTMPDLILVFTVSPEVALERMIKRGRKLEDFDKKRNVQERVLEAYQHFVDDRTLGVRCVAINGEQSIEDVHHDVMIELDRIGLEVARA